MSHDAEKESLRRLPLFEGLAEGDLDRLLEMARNVSLKQGDTLLREGEPGDEMYVVLDGELDVTQRQGSVEHVIARRVPLEVVGEMALLEQAPRSATVRAATDARLVAIDRHAFTTLLSCSPNAGTTILRTVAARLRDMESAFMQRAKLAALGTMAAGLAHELNNPAAALARSAKELRIAMTRRDRAAVALFEAPLAADEMARALALGTLTAERATAASDTSGAPAARTPDTGREDELQGRLTALGVDRPWDAAAALGDADWTVEEIDQLLATFSTAHRHLVIDWLAADASCHGLLDEMRVSTAAISSLVGAVKEYAYLDRAPVNEVDLNAGLNNTLIMLKHKLKHGIEIVRELDPELPHIEAYGSELNQVWSNLIDNAVAAMEGSGRLTLRTATAGDQVTVEVSDTGPGIPEAAQSRLFEPFFTTKAVGEGTGLGLYIAWNIVVQRHGGQLQVASSSDGTTFHVTLPRTLRTAVASA